MRIVLLVLTIALAGCASSNPRPAADRGFTSPIATADTSQTGPESGYLIGPADKLKMVVFQVPDLSFDEIFVDASGNLQLPLLGVVHAAGLTPAQLSAEVERQLGSRYLRNPQVTVTVTEAASQKVTVDGAVVKPGVYEMRGRVTLLQAVAMAEGPTRAANLQSVAVFRNGPNGRMVAVFDLGSIRNGLSQDPVIRGDDIVVVDTSKLSRTIQDAIAILPGLAVFAYF